MRITSLVENTSRRGLPVEHGLSLYIQLEDGRNVLFDMGQSDLFAQNAKKLGLRIEDVDIAIISHGHYDHGGGLRTFLEQNHKAKIYLHTEAFEGHYSLRETGLRYIGLDTELADNTRLVFCTETTCIAPGLTIFSSVGGNCLLPHGNRLLYGPDKTTNDCFCHEQNLIIQEGNETVLFAGCAHSGIINIMRKSTELIGHAPSYVLAGMHLVKSGLNEQEEDKFISQLAKELKAYSSTQFLTMHCTGEEAYSKLRKLMGGQIEYLSCGDNYQFSNK
ncbi:MAG: MBL fold metallo-hydrolase [Bacteroidales bacterium]|nr:MBL fold metallo-hydrolase [Bacteroidales bacterium]